MRAPGPVGDVISSKEGRMHRSRKGVYLNLCPALVHDVTKRRPEICNTAKKQKPSGLVGDVSKRPRSRCRIPASLLSLG